MRILVLLSLLTFLTACGSESDTIDMRYLDEPYVASAFALDCTTFSQTAPHAFYHWGTLTADEYACTGLAQMTCASYRTSEHVEHRCETTSLASPQGVPAGCTAWNSGNPTLNRIFFDGTTRTVHAYDCGIMSDEVRCTYYQAQDGSGREEFLCLDGLPPGRRTQRW